MSGMREDGVGVVSFWNLHHVQPFLSNSFNTSTTTLLLRTSLSHFTETLELTLTYFTYVQTCKKKRVVRSRRPLLSCLFHLNISLERTPKHPVYVVLFLHLLNTYVNLSLGYSKNTHTLHHTKINSSSFDHLDLSPFFTSLLLPIYRVSFILYLLYLDISHQIL